MVDTQQPQQTRPEPKYIDVENASVEVPQYGDTLPAKVIRLGMTTADEVFREKAKQKDQKILMVFFQTDDGLKGQTPFGYYAHPSQRSKIARFVRKYGQPKVGMAITILRDENGFWGVAL